MMEGDDGLNAVDFGDLGGKVTWQLGAGAGAEFEDSSGTESKEVGKGGFIITKSEDGAFRWMSRGIERGFK